MSPRRLPRRVLPRTALLFWLSACLSGCSVEPEPPASAATLLRQFPDQSAAVLEAREAFVGDGEGFQLGAAEVRGRPSRPHVVLPREGSASIRFRTAAGVEVRVREHGVTGEGTPVGQAVAYRRHGGTSFWSATDHGVEEWLLLDEGIARGEVVAVWQVEGATPRARGEEVELVAAGRGAAVLRVSAPRAYASSGRPVDMALTARGSRIELSVDAGGEAVLVDPAWEQTAGAMNVARSDHTATLLPSGLVLVAGGLDMRPFEGVTLTLDSAELYDPETDSWSFTGKMRHARGQHTATLLLPSGKVLVAGGVQADFYEGDAPLDSAELYDPETGTWTDAATLQHARAEHTATLLPSGKVLVAGGRPVDFGDKNVELYEPEADRWTFTGTEPLQTARTEHAALLLPSGKVLVTGGFNSIGSLASAELYDPETGGWTPTASMCKGRRHHTMTLLPDGEVLAAGGEEDDRAGPAGTERYDPEVGGWTCTAPMSYTRVRHTATLMPDGLVLVTGGIGRSAERYDPAVDAWFPTSSMQHARRGHTATLLTSGEVLVAGGQGHEYALAESERLAQARGEACSAVSACFASDHCVDGICCDAPCPCGTCNNRGQCGPLGSVAKAGTICAPPRCDGDTSSLAPAVCTFSSSSCPRQASVDCIAYRCDPELGACKTGCASIDDCAPGFVCNLRGHCVRPPAPGAVGGCSAAPSASSSAAPRGLGLLLLGLGAARRRRRSAAGARLSALLASALLLGGCGAEPEDTSAVALRLRFPDHADAVLSATEAFTPAVDGFRLDATEPGGAWLRAARPEVVLPRDGSGEIRFRRAEGGEIRVRELGAFGEGRVAERAVSYGRAGGASYWTATEGGVEEWLLLEEGVARRGEPVAAWQVEGAALRERGAAVELVDEESGAAVLRVTAPRAYAASGRTVVAALTVRGARIELSVDPGNARREAVLVDPAWELTGRMNVYRSEHTATLLPSGKVLVAGGGSPFDALASAEVYDPMTDTWTPAASMNAARSGHTATLLPESGKVLVAGGNGVVGSSAEVYDPMTDTWTPAASMSTARSDHTATPLLSGGVLVVSGCTIGCSSDAEVYDPTTDTWTPTGPMNHARYLPIAIRLKSGKVLVAGGTSALSEPYLDSVELYDPAERTWTSAAPMKSTRVSHAGTLLPSGKVLVMGGHGSTDRSDGAEVYDPTSGAWTRVKSMNQGRMEHAATLLPSGKVLVTAGNLGDASSSAEVYDPSSDVWTLTPRMADEHVFHTATLLPTGEVLVTGSSMYAERYTNLGAACRSDADCALNVCIEGVCCDSPCTEPCHTCARSTSLGQCVPQPKGSDIRNECANTGCDGTCDGFGACSAVPLGAACSPGGCLDETHSLAPVHCPADGGTCSSQTDEAREPVDCAPYRCARGDGACRVRCTSLQDCAPGFVCDLSGSCVRPPPDVSRGCSASRAEATGTSGSDLGALLLALLALGQRNGRTPRRRLAGETEPR
ncbi:kelch repeat-containing protein [Sorangium sp. So ce1099]|uniref:kelch repeat-containing protein n=1 Tax=Sorangium sp. So ce1099 TaxID=3133331 RepID=UPI003F5E63C3